VPGVFQEEVAEVAAEATVNGEFFLKETFDRGF
jgi:hypothetical protein